MKIVNFAPKLVVGTARDFLVKVEAWIGRIAFMAVPLDDFKVILGLEFLMTAKAVVVTHLSVLTVLDESSPCMIPVERKGKGKALSALQVKIALQQGWGTYLVTLVLNEFKENALVPRVVTELLREYANVVPPEPPKSLPPRRAVDHQNELEGGP
ncbi:hypothetical protein AMTRI_Chr10g2730 [Amborella trichopoda]